MIDINLYYGGPLVNPNEIDGFPFKGLGIQCYYMMIRRKLKTLNDLKMKIIKELKLNPACYDIKIIYCYPQEVLHKWINYRHMAIKEDKHVKIDGSEIYDCHLAKIVINQEKTVRIYYAYWWQSITDGATVTKWAVNFRQRFCNALAVEHKYNYSLPMNGVHNYKR